jgi:hypothetical protein
VSSLNVLDAAKQTELLAAESVRCKSRESIIRNFVTQAGLNPNEKSLYYLEQQFRYGDSIKIIRKQVEKYEKLLKEQAEKLERAKQENKEAITLQKEAESIKHRNTN